MFPCHKRSKLSRSLLAPLVLFSSPTSPPLPLLFPPFSPFIFSSTTSHPSSSPTPPPLTSLPDHAPLREKQDLQQEEGVMSLPRGECARLQRQHPDDLVAERGWGVLVSESVN